MFEACPVVRFQGDIQLLSLLAEDGLNIHARNAEGWNALHVAASGGELPLLEIAFMYSVREFMRVWSRGVTSAWACPETLALLHTVHLVVSPMTLHT